MKARMFLMPLVLFFFGVSTVFAGVSGTWTTIDDKTGKKRAVVQIS